VALGRDFYYGVLHHPENMPKDKEFERLLYIVYEAYNNKHNKTKAFSLKHQGINRE